MCVCLKVLYETKGRIGNILGCSNKKNVIIKNHINIKKKEKKLQVGGIAKAF